jgi:hypothetical protein
MNTPRDVLLYLDDDLRGQELEVLAHLAGCAVS